jgi:predicted ester cyclase
MLEKNKELVKRYYKEAMEGLSGIEEVVAAEFVDNHFPPGTPAGPEGVRQFFTGVLGSVFSDMQIEIDYLIAEGDKVDCHFALLAKHTGEFAGIAPKGNQVRCPAISTFRIKDGLLVEAWELFDSGDLMQQLQA